MSETMLSEGTVYGPLKSRRYGRSLGINLLPDSVKVCGFNCNYCELGWTFALIDHPTLAGYSWRSAQEIADDCVAALSRLQRGGEKLDRMTISGNGEPTLHPYFHEVCRRIVETRDRVWKGLPIGILTNAAMLSRPGVVEGLNLLDERVMKMDGGNERMFLTMNSPTFHVSLKEILGGFSRLKPFSIQTMFTRGRCDNTGEDDVDDWIARLGELKPMRVEIYTLDRPAADPKACAVPKEDLEAIAQRARSATGLEVRVC